MIGLIGKKKVAEIQASREMYWNDMVRKATPALIEEYKDHILIDTDTYVSCVIVGVPTKHVDGFPQNLDPSFTDQLMRVSATDEYTIGISYKCAPIAPEEAQSLLDNAMYKTRVSMAQMEKETKKESGVNAHSLRYDFENQDWTAFYGEIYRNKQRMFDTQYIITIWGTSLEAIRKAISRIKGVLKSNIVRFDMPYYRMLDTFIAAQPYPTSIDIAEMQQLSTHCGTLMPLRNPLSGTDEEGMVYGLQKSNGAPYIINLEKMGANHHIIVGATRSGKTVTMMMLLMRGYSLFGHRYVYITPKPDTQTDFLAVAEYFGDKAEIINIGPKKEHRNINPLQVVFDRSKQNTDDELVQIFNNHLELLTSFFSVLSRGTTSANIDNYINSSLIELYKRHGIHRTKVNTWANLKGEKWPVLLDLRAIWQKDGEKNVSAQAMLNKTFLLTTSWSYINRPTDVEMGKDIIMIDISDVPGTLKDAMNVFMVGLVGQRFNTDESKQTNVIIDEGRVFLQDEKLLEFILRMFTQGGSFGLSAWFSTQQPSDFSEGEVADLVRNNSFVNIIMGNMRQESIDPVKSFFKLSSTDVTELQKCGQGQGLVIANNLTTAVEFKLTDLEEKVILGKPMKTVTDVGLSVVDDRLVSLIQEHEIIIDDWMDGDTKELAKDRVPYQVQKSFDRGLTRAWVRPDFDFAGNQSPDHYGTVMQIAGYMKLNGWDVTVNHHDDADIVATKNNETVAIEYEVPESHAKSQLIEKKHRAETKHGNVLFVVRAENYKQVSEAVGTDCTVKRGSMLREYMEEYT